MARRDRYNDDDRRAFVANDEYWYLRQRESGKSERSFVRAARAEIDESMRATRENRRRAHDDPATGSYVGNHRSPFGPGLGS